jgi:acyl-CoA thioesterase FadM
MNLYLRLLWALWRSASQARIQPGDTIERVLRVWPNDLDINGHMNNGRYLTVIDLMLVEYFVRSGFARVMLKAGWRPMSGGALITYRKGLQPWQAYRLRFTLAGADAAWNYMRFEFLRLDGTLCAAGYMKGAAVGRDGLVPNALSYARMGHAFAPMDLPDAVEHWKAAETCVMAASKP